MKKTLTSLFVLALLTTVPRGAAAAPITWAGNGHEYELITGVFSWTEARDAATAIGWHLATVTSAAEHDFIVENVLPATANSRAHFWIGGTDSVSENVFQWVTGEPWAFTAWWGGEPNNASNEDHLAYDFRDDWGWNDASNNLTGFESFRAGYVRERVGQTVPEPATVALLGVGLLGIMRGRRRTR